MVIFTTSRLMQQNLKNMYHYCYYVILNFVKKGIETVVSHVLEVVADFVAAAVAAATAVLVVVCGCLAVVPSVCPPPALQTPSSESTNSNLSIHIRLYLR